MEWHIGQSSRGYLKMRVSDNGDYVYFEPVVVDDRDIRADLMRFMETREAVTLKTMYDYFDTGIAERREKVIEILEDLSK